MPESPVLDVAIGMVFCYASVALLASAANEMIASLFKLRARSLLAGVKQLLNDPLFNGLAQQVYSHALVNPRGDGKAANKVTAEKLPSYIRAESFASALIDTVQKLPGDAAQVKASIDSITDEQLRTMLQGMYVRAAGDINHLHLQVSDWFDDAMDRVSGTYKRRAQLLSFLVALAICILFNIDSVHLFRSLWEHPTLVAALASTPADQDPSNVLNGLLTLPIGQDYPLASERMAWIHNIIGLLVTASAAMFGAPFWFDLLQRLVQLRGTGPSPQDPPVRVPAVRGEAYRVAQPGLVPSAAQQATAAPQ